MISNVTKTRAIVFFIVFGWMLPFFPFSKNQVIIKDWDLFRRKDCRENLITKEELKKTEYILTIVGVIDGDSICGKDEKGFHYEIRLDGIDAPEFRQSHYSEAKKFLADKVLSQTVWMRVGGFDRYNRVIALIYPEDSIENNEVEKLKTEDSINLLLVKKGWAWVYRYFNKEEIFINAEEEAKQKRKGLWQKSNPQNPYQCRKTKKCR